jgi:hypothetical protein
MDVNAFYSVLAGLSFTLLGLWWVACQSRMSWLIDRVGRGMAYVVSLHFALPGAMSLLSLVAPEAPLMWRITFATAGLAGMIGALLVIATMRRRAADAGPAVLLQWVAVPVYAIVTVVAVVPTLVSGFGLTPLQVEGVALVVLILLGTQSAWLVTFAAGSNAD